MSHRALPLEIGLIISVCLFSFSFLFIENSFFSCKAYPAQPSLISSYVHSLAHLSVGPHTFFSLSLENRLIKTK